MSAVWILLLGVLHGLQPDHAAAAASFGARQGMPAWRAALRVAFGHAAALGLFALAAAFVPARLLAGLESVAGVLGGASLVVVGAVLVFQVIRARYVLHAHRHVHGAADHAHLHAHPVGRAERHEHRHARGAVAVGLALGFGGARSLLVMLPAAAGPGAGLAAVVLYCLGILGGVVALSGGVDLLRGLAGARAKWLDVVAGTAAMLAGARLLGGL